MTQTNTNAIPMTKPFSTNPKLADWVPSEQQIQTITAARELLDLVPEEGGDSTNKSVVQSLPSLLPVIGAKSLDLEVRCWILN